MAVPNTMKVCDRSYKIITLVTPNHSWSSQSVYEEFYSRSAERHAVGPLQITCCDHITTSKISIHHVCPYAVL